MILTLFLIIVITVTSINIIYSYSNKNKLKFAVIISMNFLERIPKCFEITYYGIVSLVLIDPSFIRGYINFEGLDFYDQYLNYYNVQQDYFNNSQLYFLRESLYPLFYLQGQMVENNINIFLGQKPSILKNLQKYENKFNEKNNFCYNAAIGSIERVLYSIKTPNEYFSLANQKVNLCYMYNPGVNLYGLLVEINFIYQELTNKYYDFIKSYDKYESAIIHILSDDINRMILDFDYAFEFVFRTYSHFVLIDIDNLYLITLFWENVFSFILLGALIFILFYVFFLIGSGNKKYKKLFMFFNKMY